MPSRRRNIELDEQERHAFLNQARTIILVSNGRRGYPHPMPMWFCIDSHGTICCTTFAKSQKVLNLRRDPRASLVVETGDQYSELKGVVVEARAEIVAEERVVLDVLMGIAKKRQVSGTDDNQPIRSGLERTAKKRVALLFAPERFMSWDHSKLGGRY